MTNVIKMNEHPIFIKRLVAKINADSEKLATLHEYKKQEQKLMEDHGWIIHHVIGIGSHTHGIKESFGGMDIEIALNLHPDQSSSLIWTAFRLMETGVETGKRYGEVIEGFDVLFIVSPKEPDRLRMILPDPEGELEKDNMSEPYNKQYEE